MPSLLPRPDILPMPQQTLWPELGAELAQAVSNTLWCRVERGGPVLVLFFGNLALGEIAPRELVYVAANSGPSLLSNR